MTTIKMMLAVLVCRLLPKRVIAMALVAHSKHPERQTVLDLFDQLTREIEAAK